MGRNTIIETKTEDEPGREVQRPGPGTRGAQRALREGGAPTGTSRPAWLLVAIGFALAVAVTVGYLLGPSGEDTTTDTRESSGRVVEGLDAGSSGDVTTTGIREFSGRLVEGLDAGSAVAADQVSGVAPATRATSLGRLVEGFDAGSAVAADQVSGVAAVARAASLGRLVEGLDAGSALRADDVVRVAPVAQASGRLVEGFDTGTATRDLANRGMVPAEALDQETVVTQQLVNRGVVPAETLA